jgi:hypothetical protein
MPISTLISIDKQKTPPYNSTIKYQKEKNMKKVFRMIFVILMFVTIFGCASAVDPPTNAGINNEPNILSEATYIGFTNEDVAGKILYMVGSDGYQKLIFKKGGILEIGDLRLSDGAWKVENGKLITSGTVLIPLIADFTLMSDDQNDRYFTVLRSIEVGLDNTPPVETVVGLFYDQITGQEQAEEYVKNHMSKRPSVF